MNAVQQLLPVGSQCDVLCFGESLGLIASDRSGRLAEGATAALGFGGAESNVAIALARLEHRVTFVSALGNDPFGWRIFKTLRAEGVNVAGLEISSAGPTAMMLRDRVAWGEPSVHYYRRGSCFSLRCAELARTLPLVKYGILLMSGITPSLSAECRMATASLLERARATGTRVWFDLNYRSKLWSREEAGAFYRDQLGRIDGVFASQAEAELVFPGVKRDDLANRFLDAGTRELVIKAGAQGAAYFSSDAMVSREAFAIPAEIDPIGAGDAFDAGFLSARLDGLPLADQLDRACALGALACLNLGDWEGVPTRAELARFRHRDTASQR